MTLTLNNESKSYQNHYVLPQLSKKKEKKAKCVKIPFYMKYFVLHRCPDLHIMFYRPKKTAFVWYRSLQKLHHNHLNMFLIENENNYIKIIIPCNIPNHIELLAAIRYFLKIVQA